MKLGSRVNIVIDINSFKDYDDDAIVYSSTLYDPDLDTDSDLPSWIIFDEATALYSGTTNGLLKDSLTIYNIKVIATDFLGGSSF